MTVEKLKKEYMEKVVLCDKKNEYLIMQIRKMRTKKLQNASIEDLLIDKDKNNIQRQLYIQFLADLDCLN